MNWFFEAYSNIYNANAKLRAKVPAGRPVSYRTPARRDRWQGLIARQR
jgi:hypothetical protein